MLRNLATSEQRRLLDCYNNIWWSGQVPEACRTAIVAPILKSNKPANELSSYRLVSLTSAACKVMDAIALARLEWVARACGFLADQQTGFRRRRCTADSIADVISTLEDARASGDLAMLLLIDVKGAFDGLPHAVVQQALDLLGIGGNLRRFLSSFLNDRPLRMAAETSRRYQPAQVDVIPCGPERQASANSYSHHEGAPVPGAERVTVRDPEAVRDPGPFPLQGTCRPHRYIARRSAPDLGIQG
ncbi:hypothetical protein HPB49_013713 [Dermacentor silvarum]|uniref:Uncharacterized protein n=1 Tax=Dermacentor silvarum TaxID=543639 RepID=A0ACB8CL79_DERSI|nr:hypothetical protein HPB49_013713 [Dermacentor silvarum]